MEEQTCFGKLLDITNGAEIFIKKVRGREEIKNYYKLFVKLGSVLNW
jgi:hypothetical protein